MLNASQIAIYGLEDLNILSRSGARSEKREQRVDQSVFAVGICPVAIFKRAFFAVALMAAFGTGVAAQGVVARGEYLAILGDCAGCHTAPRGPAYAGGLPFVAAFGTIYSPNITPDKHTGIGNWTSEQFYRALHEGIASDGQSPLPGVSVFLFYPRHARR